MRAIDSTIVAKLQSGELRPFTLLHFNIDSTDYRYTDCDVPLIVGEHVYQPRDFSGQTISYSINNIVDQATIEIDNLDDILTPAFVDGTPQGSDVTISLVVVDEYGFMLSADLTTNGSFDTDTDWTKGTGWTISSGRANCDYASGTTDIYQSIATMDADRHYRVGFFVYPYTQGSVSIIIGGTEFEEIGYTGGPFLFRGTVTGIAGSTDTNLVLRGNNFVGSVSLVELYESLDPVTLFQGEIGPWEMVEGKITMTITNQFSQWSQKTLNLHSASCRWKVFKGDQCSYSGSEAWCDRTYSRCQALGNTANFGGFRWLPSIKDKQIWWGAVPK